MCLKRDDLDKQILQCRSELFKICPVVLVNSICAEIQELNATLFISLIRMRSKRDIKMGRLCTPGGAVLGIVGGGCDVPFFKW